MAKKCPTCGAEMRKYIYTDKNGKDHTGYVCPNLACGLEKKPPAKKKRRKRRGE